jgi:arsenite methyltransferase
MSVFPQDAEELRAAVRQRYAQTIKDLSADSRCCDTGVEVAASSCCGPAPKVAASAETTASCCSSGCCEGDQVSGDLYSAEEIGTLPLAAVLASRGCGNPTALIDLQPGQKVLDLGSGGGIDVLLSARRVAPGGFAYGLDMTEEMLALAERNRSAAGIENVQFLKGLIEDIPLPDNSVDVIISNCVINLSADKGQVLREAYRVLAPQGRFAVSDIIVQGQVPAALRADLESWAGCIAGALEEDLYRRLLTEAGFSDISFEVTSRYSTQDIADSGAQKSLTALSPQERDDVEGKFVSAFIRARKL